jgi:hypothetical protein
MAFTRGLHELGDGCFAYLQPDGDWGWSNAGLIVGDGVSLRSPTRRANSMSYSAVSSVRSSSKESS